LASLAGVGGRVSRGQLPPARPPGRGGRGLESPAPREYTPGAAFRSLACPVSARHDALLLKRFQEEEDLHVYVLLDCSRSMGFGAPVKFDLARRLAAALGYIALADLDRVAILGFAGGLVGEFPLTRGQARILSL